MLLEFSYQTGSIKRINVGFSLEIKALMINIVYENKNFLRSNFPRNSQLRPKKKKNYKKSGSPHSKGNPNKKNRNQELSSQTQISVYIIIG